MVPRVGPSLAFNRVTSFYSIIHQNTELEMNSDWLHASRCVCSFSLCDSISVYQ